eukprot:scaffold4120_cov400-Prasinococcus_capsulatus_cf.AAC.6
MSIAAAQGPWIWYKTVREIITLERMHRAFDSGLMTYGMIKGVKVLHGAIDPTLFGCACGSAWRGHRVVGIL